MKWFKLFLSSFLAFLLLSATVFPALASLIRVDKDGGVVIKVLSFEDSIELEVPKNEHLEVKDVVDQATDPTAKISLFRENGRVKLNISGSSGDRSLDVTNYSEEVIEIEERPEVEKLLIGISGGKFTIEQKGVVAETELAIIIDPQTAGLTLETPSGFKYLSILPRQAVDSVLRSKYINRIASEKRLILSEEEKQLAYIIEGEKVINLFNVFEYSTPVSIRVSASTGEILSVEQPTWLKVIGFLFV